MIQRCRTHLLLAVFLFFFGVQSLKVKEVHEVVHLFETKLRRQPAEQVVETVKPEPIAQSEIADSTSATSDGKEGLQLPGKYLALSASERTAGNNLTMLTTVFLWVFVGIFLFIAATSSSDGDTQPDAPSDMPRRVGSAFLSKKNTPVSSAGRLSPMQNCSPVNSSAVIQPPSSMSPRSAPPSSRPRTAEELELDKEALRLCLRCEIFSSHEYANNRISQEHIDECLWIARTMLTQMSLEDWAQLSQQDRQRFEDNVDSLLQATPLPGSFATPYSEQRLPMSQGMLTQGSGMSLAPTIPRMESQNAGDASPWDTAPMPEKTPKFNRDTQPIPEKSPVPQMNCGNHAHSPASSVVSTEADLGGAFGSVFGSTNASPQESQRSSPLENSVAPPSGYTVAGSGQFSFVPDSPIDEAKIPQLVKTDPDDMRNYTFRQLQDKYEDLYDMAQLEHYWLSQCMPLPASEALIMNVKHGDNTGHGPFDSLSPTQQRLPGAHAPGAKMGGWSPRTQHGMGNAWSTASPSRGPAF